MGRAFLQEAHRREDGAGAAEGIGEGEPVGEVELAQHREMAFAHGGLHGNSAQECQSTREAGKRFLPARSMRLDQCGIAKLSAVNGLPMRGTVGITESSGSAPLPSRYASTRSSAAYTYGSNGTYTAPYCGKPRNASKCCALRPCQ